MVDHEINEPLKPYSCQSNFYVDTYPKYVVYIYSNYLGLKTLVYELYNYIFIHIKLVVNH